MPSPGGPPRKRRRIRFDLQKAMFVLPNLFTVSSVFCGFYAITLCVSEEANFLWRAAIAIFFGMFFDMFDGRVARLTRTQSEFGVQLDSLADMVSFGVAPAVLLYTWMLNGLGFVGLFVGFLYTACGALRLARFNVLASREPGSSKYFLGLPIPLAAGTVVALVLSSHQIEDGLFPNPVAVAVITVILALLMVSNVRYRTFKDLRPSKKSITIAFVLGVIFAGVSAQMKPTIALAAFFLGYITLGLAEGVLFFRSRRAEVEEALPDEGDAAEADEEFADDEEEDEVEDHQERTA